WTQGLTRWRVRSYASRCQKWTHLDAWTQRLDAGTRRLAARGTATRKRGLDDGRRQGFGGGRRGGAGRQPQGAAQGQCAAVPEGPERPGAQPQAPGGPRRQGAGLHAVRRLLRPRRVGGLPEREPAPGHAAPLRRSRGPPREGVLVGRLEVPGAQRGQAAGDG